MAERFDIPSGPSDDAPGDPRQGTSEARWFKETFERAAVGIAHVSPDGAWLRVNPRVCEITGFSAGELTAGMTFQDITHPEDLMTDVERADLLLGGTIDSYSMHKRYVRRDGSIVWVSLSVTLVRDRAGAPEFFIAVIDDIDDIKRAEAAAALSATLNEIDEAINSSQDFDSIMAGTLERASLALGVETAAVTLREGTDWVITHTYGFPGEYVGVHLTSEDVPHAQLAVDTRTVVAIDDARSDPRTKRDVIERFEVRSVMVVPLRRAGEVYGAIFFNHSTEPVPFTEEQQDFGRKLAAHVSLAVENAALFAAEKRIAETLQEGLLSLPSAVPGVTFAHEYRSSSDIARVGGDFYDVFELETGTLCIVVGDVSGKGLEAAMLTARVKSTIRAEASAAERTPADVLLRLNDLLVRDTDSEVFVTVFLGMLDRVTGELRYASGGHTAGIVVRGSSGTMRLGTTGPIVGAFLGLPFDNARIIFEPGDTLVLYTDGVIEARGESGMYSEEQLIALLRTMNGREPAEIVDRTIAEVTTFAGKLTDDLAIMAVRWPN